MKNRTIELGQKTTQKLLAMIVNSEVGRGMIESFLEGKDVGNVSFQVDGKLWLVEISEGSDQKEVEELEGAEILS